MLLMCLFDDMHHAGVGWVGGGMHSEVKETELTFYWPSHITLSDFQLVVPKFTN